MAMGAASAAVSSSIGGNSLARGQRAGSAAGAATASASSPSSSSSSSCCSLASVSWSAGGEFQGETRAAHLAAKSRSRNGACSAGSGGRLRVDCVGWDPENILGRPQPGHIARRSFEKQFKSDVQRNAALDKIAKEEFERRRVAREARIVPQTNAGLVEFFMETEAQEMEYEIARCRPRLDADFFSYLRSEIGLLRIGLNPPEGAEDKAAELEGLEQVVTKGVEAYDKLAADISGARDRLTEILVSKNKRETILQLAGENKLDRNVLVLLDQNIAAAAGAGQKEAAEFMSKIRGAMVKYMTA